MKISVIIPTHNRQDFLKNAIESVLKLRDECNFEIVVVDNNSTDNTKKIAESYSEYVKYVFEKRTAFTRARKTGGENATGNILLFLDDDVIVNKGSFKNIVDVFTKYPDCGIIAGKILPKYIEKPPLWTLKCQENFNGWSLFNKNTYPFITESFQEVPAAAGPMMAISRMAYDSVNGFPPDTIGVETNKSIKTFNKLYIGPGDYGLCCKIKEKGWKVYYSEDISVYHIILPIRFTIEFWRSRVIGEGYQQAIAQREFYNLNKLNSFIERKKFRISYRDFKSKLSNRLNSPENIFKNGMYPEELWVHYYKAYLDMDAVLRKYPWLSSFLWEIADNGVDDSNFDYVMNRLPDKFKKLVSNESVYNPNPINSTKEIKKVIKDFGSHNKIFSDISIVFYYLFNIAKKEK
ncbi:MAG: glycosyltransferase family 2 protein [Bacteroidales bacterium]|nr:glycosyltransferase family 2 protein [Bacteroidales bacterium]